ncbi:MAG: SDR family NAD(P)-dependent oxidoreductase, partial [Pseudomonadota bacterium]
SPDATYLITGGTGGLGLQIADWLITQEARHLLLVSRRAPDAEVSERLAALKSRGVRVTHIAADATIPGAISHALDRLRPELGAIHGAVVATLALQDGALATMSVEALRTALAAKSAATQELARALSGEALDFLLIHGSAQSFAGTAGQANYAAGATFQDAFVAALARATGWPVHIVNWGFWGEVGAVASPAYHERLAAAGVLPITTAEGIEALERVLSAGARQVVAIRASDTVLESLGADPTQTAERVSATAPPLMGRAALPAADAAKLDAAEEGLAAWERWGRARLLALLWAAGLSDRKAATRDVIAARLNVRDAQRPILDALLDVLATSRGLIVGTDGVTLAEADPEPVLRPVEMADHGRLLEACLNGLPAILSGERRAADVLFPDGSTHLVEPVYRGDALMEHLQRATAATIAGAVKAALGSQTAPARITVMEVGAGTGGTTDFLAASLV